MYLSVVIPAYNEEKRIGKTLREVNRYLEKQNYEYEILVVDDGSKDDTVKVAEALASEIRNLKVIGYGKNQGKGYAVRFGLSKATGEYRLFTDADNSTSIDQIEKMWPWFEKGFDIVIGSRDIKGAVLDPPQPWIRHMVLGEGFKFYRKLIIGLWNVQDTQCGFKCFGKGAAENISPKCKINRFAFDAEMLVVSRRMKYKIKEIPVYWKNDLESKVKAKSIFNMALDLLKIRFYIVRGLYEKR